MDDEERWGRSKALGDALGDVIATTSEVDAAEEPASASDLIIPSMSSKLVSRVKGSSPGNSFGGWEDLFIRIFLIRDSFFKESCERDPVGE